MDAQVPPGLSQSDACSRLDAEGRNALPSAPPKRLYQRILAQFTGGLSLLLLGALVLDAGLWLHQGHGVPIEPLAIVAVLVFNAILGVLQEYRSERVLTELKNLSQPLAWVFRDGALQQIPAEELVREDVLRVDSGDRVPADGVLLQQSAFAVDESMLTGESIPVDKRVGDEVSSGTVVVRGHALVQITAVGANSAMGRLAGQLLEMETGHTPLERRISAFGTRIAWAAGISVVALITLGLVSEGVARASTVVTFAIALAVAVVPEGLPAVITLTLALGVERMARRKAVVRRLSAVEALGSVTVIATDKTGTMTENRLTVVEIFGDDERRLLEACVLANDADPSGAAGDPLDLALLAYAGAHGVEVARLRRDHPRLSARPFDSEWKYMRASVDSAAGTLSFVKGACEAIFPLTTLAADEERRFRELTEREARRGHRVIAVASGSGEAEQGLSLLGLVAFWDPPRANVRAAVESVLNAGVRVLMITGDHPTTAVAIAEHVGLGSPEVATGEELRNLPVAERARRLQTLSIVARASADDKLAIVEALQADGEIVAMTGDGINDAPALKRADVGVAMGLHGSDVAREVSDLVLLDDNFATIVGAVEEGRNIRDNIQKFIRFTFSTNVALAVLVLGGAIGSYVIGLRDASGALILPLTAIQVLFINFVGDGPPALALALDRNPSVMQQPPQPSSAPLLDTAAWRFIAFAGMLAGAIGLSLLVALPLLGLQVLMIQTLVFAYESCAKLVSVYPARRTLGDPAPNRALRFAMALGMGLLLACLYVPQLRNVLGLSLPSPTNLLGVALCVLGTWGLVELFVLYAYAGPPSSSSSTLASSSTSTGLVK